MKLVTVNEAANRLRLAPVTIRLWKSKRKIATVKLGRAVRIPESEIARLIESNFTPTEDVSKKKSRGR